MHLNSIETPEVGSARPGPNDFLFSLFDSYLRGPDGRYTLPTDSESYRRPGRSNVESPTPAQTNDSPPTAHTGQDTGSDNVADLCHSDRNNGIELSGYDLPSSARTIDRRAKEAPHATLNRSQSTLQPSFVGESWYASYVMRCYAPGHTSLHRPIVDCNQTVQKVSLDTQKQSSPKRSLPPRERTELLDLPPPALMDRLIKAYFDRFHAFCPILAKKSFLASLRDGSLSGTLLRSVLFVASLHCDLEILHLMGHSTRLDANHDLFNKASALFNEDRESDRTNMVLSSYLLHYWFGNPTSYRDSHWWLAAAIRSAQCMGYHRSTKNSQLPPEEKSRWKRIWWCLYVSQKPFVVSLEGRG